MLTSPAISITAWPVVKRLYEQASELAAPAREAFIAAAQVEEAVRAEVRSLLAHDPDQMGRAGFLSEPAALEPAQAPERMGELLGQWQIVRPLGAGGMGDVFEARRADGSYQGRAAIKLIKRGMDSAAVLQRFAQERQALARLNHPHIATLLDAGLSGDGLPYFVMEFVDGVPIDQAARALALKQRLQLFLQLADAVAYAHRSLVVHRDLKPGNVLITPQGQVKLLDFGIAKALDPAGADNAEGTIGAARPYTPSYASPEQVRGESMTTATDIYSLGVILHLLLTGVRPTGRDAATPAQAARSVLEETPVRPSELPAGVSPDPQWPATRKRLRGDLDNVLLKALAKDMDARYASVEALASDLRRFLAGQPVSARAPTLGYVAGKLILRHRLAAALSALLVLSLVAGVGVSTYNANQARHRLASIKTLTHEAVFHFGDAVTYVPGGMAIKAELLQQLTSVLDRLVQASGDDVELRADAAQAYARLADIEINDTSSALNRVDAGAQHTGRALQLAREVLDAKSDDADFLIWYWRALASKARLQRLGGNPQAALQTLAEAVPLLSRGIALAERAGRADAVEALRVERARAHHLTCQMLYNPGSPHLNRPDDALAELALARSELLELSAKRHHPEIIYLLGSVDGAEAIVREARDDLLGALPAAERAMAARRVVMAELPKDVEYRDATITEAFILGRVLLRLQRPQEALAATTAGWQINQQLLGEQPAGADNQWVRRLPLLATHHGRALLAAGQPAQALPLLQTALAHWQGVAKAAPGNLDAARYVAWMQAEQAQALLALGQAARASTLAADAFARYQPSAKNPATDPAQRRAGLLVRAELAMVAARAAGAPAKAALWRAQALQALDEAAGLQPLASDHAAWRGTLLAARNW
jgi:serine/threonine protein kinase